MEARLREHVDYDGRQHTVYSAARSLTDERLQQWADAFGRWAGDARDALDLGSGTGRFTPLLADLLGGDVVGVEPSQGMRQIAERDAPHPRVRYLAGQAEAIPVPAASCDLVLMFLSFHHFRDRRAAVREIRRVLRPAGRIFVRSTFADRMPELLWHRYFPQARRIELETFPTVPQVTEVFAEAGFSVLGLETVTELAAPSLAVYAERLRLRGISTFEYLTEEETTRGLAALDAAVAADDVPGPITMDSDLLVLGPRP
jgi:ubiquinone/menaquinone biosynthesis C-methylase UbiE